MAAIEATHGVYNREKTSNDATASVDNTVDNAVVPNSTVNVETTLSFAMNPAIRAVIMRQSPNPKGAKIGVISPAIHAKMLS